MFKESKCSTEKKLANFTKYVRRQNLNISHYKIESFPFGQTYHIFSYS